MHYPLTTQWHLKAGQGHSGVQCPATPIQLSALHLLLWNEPQLWVGLSVVIKVSPGDFTKRSLVRVLYFLSLVSLEMGSKWQCKTGNYISSEGWWIRGTGHDYLDLSLGNLNPSFLSTVLEDLFQTLPCDSLCIPLSLQAWRGWSQLCWMNFHTSGPSAGSGLCSVWSLPASLGPWSPWLLWVPRPSTLSQPSLRQQNATRSHSFPSIPHGALVLGLSLLRKKIVIKDKKSRFWWHLFVESVHAIWMPLAFYSRSS